MKSCKGCKHYKKEERTRLIICEFDLHKSYCEKDKEDFAIEELEKIKDKIQSEIIKGTRLETDNNALTFCYAIIIEEIAELKGESNAE